MGKKRKRIREFMEGRSGLDQVAWFLMLLTVICLLAGCLLRFPLLFFLGCALLFYLYFRIFSGKKEKRRKENLTFLGQWEHLRFRHQVKKLERELKKTDRYAKCLSCGKTYRIPGKSGGEERPCPYCGAKAKEKDAGQPGGRKNIRQNR